MVLEAETFKTEALADLASGEGPLPDSWFLGSLLAVPLI